MKKIFFFLMLLQSAVYAQQLKYNPNTINDIAFIESQAYNRVSQSKSETSASTNFDITYYRCEWETDPAVRYIKGRVTSYFIITAASDHIAFDLMNDLHVDSVRGKNYALFFTHESNTLKIRLN